MYCFKDWIMKEWAGFLPPSYFYFALNIFFCNLFNLAIHKDSQFAVFIWALTTTYIQLFNTVTVVNFLSGQN